MLLSFWVRLSYYNQINLSILRTFRSLPICKIKNTTPELWLNMQQGYDLWEARQKTGSLRVQIMRKPDEHPAAGE